MVRKKIDKIQAEIDQMLELCDEINNTDLSEEMELGELILRAQEGDLDKEGYKRLESLLIKDKDKLQYYVDFQLLTGLLYEQVGDYQIKKMMDTILKHSMPASV